MTFLSLVSPRLILRPLLISDAAAVFAYRSEPDVARYQSWEPASVADVERLIRSGIASEPDQPGTWFQLAICRAEDGLLLGDCGLHFLADETRHAEIGITLAPEHQGRGYAAEALRAVFDYLFLTLGKHRIQGSVDPANLPSIRLLERVGMRREGHFVESLWCRDRWVDDLAYALLDREWRSS